MSDQLSSILEQHSGPFLKRLNDDLATTEKEYGKLNDDVEEYMTLKSFLSKELEFGQKSPREVMTDIGKHIYASATIPATQKILVRVQGDLFIQMSYERALKFVDKRLDFLNGIGEDFCKDIAQIKAHIFMLHAMMDPNKLPE